MNAALRLSHVFTPGGRPTVTYNPRSELGLEAHVADYLDERGRILSVSGSTKTGKTVLLKSALPTGAIWLSGGAISTESEFWSTIADELGVYTDYEQQRGSTDEAGSRWEAGGSLKVVSGKYEQSDKRSTTAAERIGRKQGVKSLARETLRGSDAVLVIDDFHYIDAEVQLRIVQSVKDLVFDGLAVIVAAVPHRAYDVVRVEKEMTGRVLQLPVGFWTKDELRQIATKGFDALNAVDRDGLLAERLATESFQSPHLMQEFCRELCKVNDVRETLAQPTLLKEPDWNPFFRGMASQTSRSAFQLLARGPRQRVDRKSRQLKDGREMDIYAVTLAAIAKTGPLTEITYEQLRAGLREILESGVPQRHEVTRVLEEMAKIAREKIEGEPVVDFDDELGVLHISDPYFAYYLRWGSQEQQTA